MNTNNTLLFLVLTFITFSFSSCNEDNVVNFAADLPGVYESISGDINVEGAVNVITLSNKGDTDALTKNLVLQITDRTRETVAGIETITYSTDNNKVDIFRSEDVITIKIISAEFVQNPSNLYIGTKRVQ